MAAAALCPSWALLGFSLSKRGRGDTSGGPAGGFGLLWAGPSGCSERGAADPTPSSDTANNPPWRSSPEQVCGSVCQSEMGFFAGIPLSLLVN